MGGGKWQLIAAAFLLIFLGIKMPLNAQINDSTNNYFNIVAVQDAYYDSLLLVRGADSMEGTGFKDYIRWKNYMGMRIDENGTTNTYMELMNDYLKNIQTDSSSSVTSQEWNYYGPTGHTDEINYTFGKGWVYCINVNKDNHNIIYAGTHNAGLWKTMDGGMTWKCLTNSIPEVFGGKSVAIPEQDTSTIYILTVESLSSHFNGVYKSEDSGENWEWIDISDANTSSLYPTPNWRYFPKKIILHPDSKDTVFVLSNHHISRSLDGGDTWDITEVYTSGEYTQDVKKEMEDIVFSSGNHNIMYTSGTDVLKSTNLGSTWVNITSSIAGSSELKVCTMSSPEDYPDFVWFFATKKSGGSNIVKYDPSNGNFHIESTTVVGNYLKSTISPSLIDTSKVFVGGINSFIIDKNNGYLKNYLTWCTPFETAGTQWNELEQVKQNKFIHNDIRAEYIVFSSQFIDTLFVCDDGGIHKMWKTGDTTFTVGGQVLDVYDIYEVENLTTKSTEGFQDLNITEVYSLDVDERNDFKVYNCQDLGGYFLDDNEYLHLHGGDGGSILIDEYKSNIVYFADYQGRLARVNLGNINNGTTLYTNVMGYEFYYFVPIIKHPEKKERLYFGLKHLYYIDNIFEATIADTILVSSLDNVVHIDCNIDSEHIVRDDVKPITDIKISHNNTDLMFVSTNQAYLWWSIDANCNTEGDIDPNYYEKALFKSVDGGNTWTDLSPNLLGLDQGYITDITLNPHNDNELWLTFGLTEEPINASARRKVYHSTNGGQSFIAFDQGLPEAMPVWEMVYDPITNDLYIATDLGVFKRNVNASQWENIFLSSENDIVKLVTDLEINNKTRTLYAATYGRGIWSMSLGDCPKYSSIPVHIDTITKWSAPKEVVSDIIVDSGAVLTITDIVFFNKDSKLIVKPGGKLELNGGILTNSCDGDYWQGVEVRGQSNQYQSPDRQGWLVMSNYGIIENALTGVLVGSSVPSDGPVGDGGGIVHATSNSQFINNITAIEFELYEMERSVSLIENCTFETNAYWPHQGAEPKEFVKMDSYSGLVIKGSSFKNIAASQFAAQARGKGIYALNSEFIVDHICISQSQSCQEYLPCSFDSLYYGIYAMATTSEKPLTISNSNFNCYKGVYLSAVDNAEIVLNDFDVHPSLTGIGNAYGLYLDESSGFHIEANAFTGNTGYQAGLYVNSSGQDDNLIYNNTFNSLYAASVFEDVNRRGRDGGLQVKCNDYSKNTSDMSVVSDDPLHTINYGIAQNQGYLDVGNPDPTLPAGNTFSDFQSHAWDIYNELGAIVYVYHNWSNVWPIKVKPVLNFGLVSPRENIDSDYSKSNACPSMLIVGGEELKSGMLVFRTSADSTQSEIEILTDGGDTDGLDFDVETAMPGEGLETRDMLLAQSPNLSDTVMVSAVEQESVLPNAMLRDVLVENPQAAKSLEVQNALDEKTISMPSYMREDIDQGLDSLSEKEISEAALTFFNQQYANNFRRLQKYYGSDTSISFGNDSLVQLYIENGSLEKTYNLGMLFLAMGDTVVCDSVFNAVQYSFNLSDEQEAERLAYLDYLSVIKQFGTRLDSIASGELQQIVQAENGRPATYSRNILLWHQLTSYSETVLLPDTTLKISKAFIGGSDIKNADEVMDYLLLKPNPAADYFIAAWELPIDAKDAELLITNTKGIFVDKILLKGNRNENVINTANWNAGAYLVSLILDGYVLESEKLSVIK